MMFRKLMPYILCAPLIILLAILLAGVFGAFLQSLGYIPALGLNNIGFNYYAEILGDKDFVASLLLSVYITVISSALSAVFGVAICAALVYARRGKRMMTGIIRIPILIPHTVAALFVTLILSQSGILSRLLYVLGFIGAPSEFPNLIYNNIGAGIIAGYVWKQAPFVAYFTLSLMESISGTLEEAAVNLGASPLKAFFKVTLPLSAPAIANALLIITAFSFGAYELPFLLGATKPKALPVQAYIEYTHPDLRNRPYAMAQNGVIIIFTLIITIAYFGLVHKRMERIKTGYEKL